jgi:hypothetical protein
MFKHKKILALAFFLSLVFPAPGAFAHKFVLTPDSFSIPQGGTAGIAATFTEIIGTPEFSLSVTGTFYDPMETVFEAVYSGTGAVPIDRSAFKPYDSRTMTAVEPEKSDIEYARFQVTGSGTIVVHGSFRGTMDLSKFGGSGESTSISHVKTFLNLTGDGIATERLGGDDVLEAVFSEEVPSGGIKEGSAVEFKFYHKGQPLRNAPVFAAYIGAPSYSAMEGDSEVELNDYLEKTTDENGAAVFLLDHAGGWFVGAFVDEGKNPEYGGGLMFEAAEAEGEDYEGDLTDFLIGEGDNRAGLGFVSWVGGPYVDLIRERWGYVNASNLVTVPRGSTSFLTGQPGQLPGDETGTSVHIPMDVIRSDLKGITGTEQMVALTPDILGKADYDAMVAFLKEERSNSPEKFFDFSGYGTWYVPYTPKLFFDNFGVAVMGRFSDGSVLDISDYYQIGVLYDEESFDAGSIGILYGTVVVDSAPVSGSYWLDATDFFFPEGSPNKFALIYDGKADNQIAFSYWLAKKSEPGSGGGGGGCDAGALGGAAVLLLLAAKARRRHS